MSAPSIVKFQKLDAVIEKYYKSLNKPYNNGFLNYCVDNGFEEDDIDEEFDNPPEECLFLEFDDNFPLKTPILDGNLRLAEMYRIMKYCYDNHDIPPAITTTATTATPSTATTPNKKLFSVFSLDITGGSSSQSQKIHSITSELYSSQCPSIFKNELSIKKCFAINIRNNYPFLINLVDSYMRDKFAYIRSKNKDLSVENWKNRSPYLKKIDKDNKKMANTLVSGIDTFLRRCIPIRLSGQNRQAFQICDDIDIISRYIYLSYIHVTKSILDNNNVTPFQCDFIFAVKSKTNIATPVYDDGGSTDCDDDPDDDDQDDAAIDQKSNIDYVGNISNNLKLNKCLFIKNDINVKINVSDTSKMTRRFKQSFDQFKTKLSQNNYYQQNPNQINNYPQKKRFCCFIDRRKANNNNNNDKIYWFEPPKNKNIPTSHVPEWNLNALKTCIFPTSKNPNQWIKADDAVNGQLLTISYHVESIDQMRVYQFYAGKYSRIYPQDIKTILKEIVDKDYKNNKNWKGNNDLDKMKFNDPDFESFYSQVSSRKHQHFPKVK